MIAVLKTEAAFDGAGPDAIMGGRKGVASFINLAFQGRLNTRSAFVNQMSISRWLRGEFLPRQCRELFPPPDGAGRFSKAKVSAWVEKYLLTPSPTIESDVAVIPDMTDYDQEFRKERALKARREREEYEKAHDGKWMLCSDAQDSLTRILGISWPRFWRMVEFELIAGLADAVRRGLTPAQLVEDARSRHQAAIDAFAKYMQDLANQPMPDVAVDAADVAANAQPQPAAFQQPAPPASPP
jgi:hypothetical protein